MPAHQKEPLLPSDLRGFVYLRETVLEGMPEAESESAAREYTDGVLNVFRARGVEPPDWLTLLAEPRPDRAP